MATLLTQTMSNVFEEKWPTLGSGVITLSDPPTMTEVWAQKLVMEVLLDAYLEDPSLFPPGALKDKWDTMYQAERADMIAEGMAIVWP